MHRHKERSREPVGTHSPPSTNLEQRESVTSVSEQQPTTGEQNSGRAVDEPVPKFITTALPEPPAHVLDEDAVERRQIRDMLSLTPVQRLASLTNAYRIHRARLTKVPRQPRSQELELP